MKMLVKILVGISVFFGALTVLACSNQPSGGGGNSDLISISGAGFLPSIQNGKNFLVVFFTNTTFVGLTSGAVTGSSFSYSYGNLPKGDYRILAFVDVDGNSNFGNSGDLSADFPIMGSTTNVSSDTTFYLSLALVP